MALRLGDIAPNFVQNVTAGDIDSHAWLGTSWDQLFSHPKDFTPVFTTELGATAKLKDEFARRKVKVLAVSIDSIDSVAETGINEDVGRTRLTFRYRTRVWTAVVESDGTVVENPADVDAPPANTDHLNLSDFARTPS